MKQRVAIVTGANRGIGLEVSRQLADRGVRVIMTARDAAKGEAARRKLTGAGREIGFHPLDVTDAASVQTLRDAVVREVGAPDILVNNAGISLGGWSEGVLRMRFADLERTMDTNLFGPIRMCQSFVPLMRAVNYGRVVNLSSGMGQLSEMGAGASAYRISKTALNALTATLAAELEGSNVLVNSMCPGWVRTDMGGASAERSVERGADTAVWLSLLPDGGPSGGFFRDRKPIAW